MLEYPDEIRQQGSKSRSKRVYRHRTSFRFAAPRPIELKVADEGARDAYLSALVIIQDMMLNLYDSGEHSRFTPQEVAQHFDEALVELAEQPALLKNAQVNYTRAQAIIELEREDRMLSAAAAQRYAEAILSFFARSMKNRYPKRKVRSQTNP